MIPVENAVIKTPRPVKVNGKWGFFREGEGLVIDAVYDSAREFYGGLAAVSTEPWDFESVNRPPLYEIINESGETVIPPFRGVPCVPAGFSCGMMLIMFSENGKSQDVSFHLDTNPYLTEPRFILPITVFFTQKNSMISAIGFRNSEK